MPSAQSNRWISFPGLSFNDQAAATTGDGQFLWQVDVPANSALNSGTMTNKTDANTGVVTLQAGHTIVTSGALVDVYFPAGVRYGMTATKAVNDITLEGGTGTDLPENATAVIVCAQTSIATLPLDGDLVTWFAVVYRNASDTGALGLLDLQDAGSASIYHAHLVHETANGGCNTVLNITGGDTNALTGNPITKGFVSHDSTSAGIVYIMALVNTTP